MIDLDTVASVWQSYVDFAVVAQKNPKVAMTFNNTVWHFRHMHDANLQNAVLNDALTVDGGNVLGSWLSREDVGERVLAMATFHCDDSPTCDASRMISEVSLAKSSESSCRREIFACCIAFSRKWMRGIPSQRAAIPDVSLLSLNNAMADCCLTRSPNWRAFK